jgi:hypothetical protein
MHASPTQGVKGVKPRFKSAKEELPKLSKEYLEIRNRQMRAKALMAETEGAARRGELLSRRLVELQLGYLLVVLRQRILSVPTAYGPRLVGMADAHAATEVLREAALALLDLQNMPDKVVDPHWIESLAEENGEKPGPPLAQERPTQAKQKSRKPPSPHPAAPGRRKPAPIN